MQCEAGIGIDVADVVFIASVCVIQSVCLSVQKLEKTTDTDWILIRLGENTS